MTSNHPEQNSKRGSALLMVLLAGVLIILIGAGMLFFYKKQVERRVLLEFDIHRKLAAKSGFALVQYPGFNGTGTYVYAVAPNRPVILVTVGEAKPVYTQDFTRAISENWTNQTDGSSSVEAIPGEYKFSTTSTNIGQRNELVFTGTNNVVWNDYPFGLCYETKVRDEKLTNWAGYVYVGVSNVWSQVFSNNATASLAIFGKTDINWRRLGLYEHGTNSLANPISSFPSAIEEENTRMNVATELYLDGNHMAFGTAVVGGNFLYAGATTLPESFSGVTNVVMGVGGFTLAIATNGPLVMNKFEVRNPFEYEIYLSWTNRNRFLGPAGIFTNVLATVVDKATEVNQYYFFDSFRTVVP